MAQIEVDVATKQQPMLSIPPSNSIVEVQIINTTCDIVCLSEFFVQPILQGHEVLNLPTSSFLVKHKGLGKTILFDLGCRKDWWNLAPSQSDNIKKKIPGLNVAKGITDVLSEGGTELKSIDSMIWSHWHWDHIGDPSLFPKSVELVIGPGVREAFLPGFPSRNDSPLLEMDFKDRHLHEITFDQQKRIGKFPYHDFFGDGSFYLLDVPGHAKGHMSALARTTPTTFVLMGGDVCHFAGTFRPTPYVHLPSTIPSEISLDRFQHPCPCSIFTACHPKSDAAQTTPFYRVSDIPGSYYTDPLIAQGSTDALQEFDANEDVLVLIAHDTGLTDVLNWYPSGNINAWKVKGWKEKSRWAFLNELPIDGKPAKDRLVPGLMREGKLI